MGKWDGLKPVDIDFFESIFPILREGDWEHHQGAGIGEIKWDLRLADAVHNGIYGERRLCLLTFPQRTELVLEIRSKRFPQSISTGEHVGVSVEANLSEVLDECKRLTLRLMPWIADETIKESIEQDKQWRKDHAL